jgi:hypothetical protein
LNLPRVTIWAERESNRLRYVLDWIFTERLGLEYTITSDSNAAIGEDHCLAYGWLGDKPSIHSSSFLWESGIQNQNELSTNERLGLTALFYDDESNCDIKYDLFAGAFYLLSRYEEYLPFKADKHDRYRAEDSILFDVVSRPIVDEWIEALRLFLEQTWNLSIPQRPFSYQPTYDIDIAWSYRFKGVKRTLGALMRDAASLKWNRIRKRINVLSEKEEDPYNSFVFLLSQHMMDEARPVYFILSALQSSPFDKNISPRHPRMAALISALSKSATVGLHPSYYSDKKPELLSQEKAVLEQITGVPIVHSRQHYIKLSFPDTYRSLIDAGIKEDWSMGYSTHFGFRAGTSHSFLWYDLKEERVTSLRVHPFAFMDSTGHYDLDLSPEEAFNRLRQMTVNLEACGGRLVSIMHNYSLGTDPEWAGWRAQYVSFLDAIKRTGKPS